MNVEQNPLRLKHLLALYRMGEGELLALLNEGRKRLLTEADIFSSSIQLAHLKRIDRIFQKGLHYYLDPGTPIASPDASIFFRKGHFEIEPNIGARKVVRRFEEKKLSLSAICKMAGIDLSRKAPLYSTQDDPKQVAVELRSTLYPAFTGDFRTFLKNFIQALADYNILVFEFVETWNQKDKANIDGFFLKPNVIVLKRQQHALRREIFTLAHELGHYLLGEEEIEAMSEFRLAQENLTSVERWCNEFAFCFLAGDYDNILDQLDTAGPTNDYHRDWVAEVSQRTNLSQMAIYTRMLFKGKISREDYRKIKEDFDEQYRRKQEEREAQKEKDKIAGKPVEGRAPKPMVSPLLVSIVQTAFHEGVLDAYDVAATLQLSPEKLERILQ